MKKRIKKLTAAIMAVAMLFSLAVTASATSNVTSWATEGTGANSPQTSTSNPVENQGALPVEVINVVMPTKVDGAYTMVFDAHGLIATTDAARYASLNNNEGATFESGSKFFFKNSEAYKAVPKTEVLLHDIGTAGNAGYVEADGKNAATVYGEVTVTEFYAKDNSGTVGWVKSDGSTPVTVATGITEANTAIDALKAMDFTKGATKDAIAAIQEKYPTLHFTSFTGTETNVAGLPGLSYQTVDISGTGNSAKARYVVGDNVYTDVGTASAVPTAAVDGSSNAITKAALEASTSPKYAVYEELKTNVVSYKKTSDTVKIVNKGSRTIGVTMKAEVSGIDGATYQYAASVDSNGKFLQEDGTTEITGKPAIYLALTNGTTTSAMTYDTTASKASAKIATTLAGSPSFYTTQWTANNKYEDVVDDTKATTDFQKMEFNLTGAINGDDGWDNLSGGSIDVTWSVKEYKTLKTPTVTANTFTAGKTWSFTIDGNKDLLYVDKVVAYSDANATQGAAELPITKTQEASTGATAFTVSKSNLPATKPGSVVITFVDQSDTDLTTTVKVIPS